MYSQTEVVFGVPLTEEIATLFDYDELETHGFILLYHGGSETPPGYCGVSLCRFDECELYTRVGDLIMCPNATQLDEANKAIDALPPAIKELLPRTSLYFIHYSS